MRVSIALLMLVAAGLTYQNSANATPAVRGFQLVNSARSGRTTFEYTYALLVEGDAQSYTNGIVTVASANSATVVTQGSVPIGSIDAGEILHSTATFTINQNRLQPFVPSDLSFKFVGTPTAAPATGSSVRVGPVVFLEDGGRPGHNGSFPIQGDTPDGGQSLVLSADIYGAVVSASYQFVGIGGQVISQGALSGTPSDWGTAPQYYAQVLIPAVPFTIAISAVDISANTIGWQSSKVYSPPGYSLRILPAVSIVPKSQSVSVTLQVTSSTATGSYTFALLLPPGFTGGAGPWTLSLSPGATTQVATSIITPTTGDLADLYILSASGFPVNQTTQVNFANIDFEVD